MRVLGIGLEFVDAFLLVAACGEMAPSNFACEQIEDESQAQSLKL